EDRDARAMVGDAARKHGGDHGLADLGSGPGDEDAARAHRPRFLADLVAQGRELPLSAGDPHQAAIVGALSRPIARAASPTSCAARRSSVGSWVAITVKRRREEPSGTVGGRMPWANTPRSSSPSQSSMVSSASPISIGTIWVV